MSRGNISWSVLLVLICGAAFVAPASAQHFQQVTGTPAGVATDRNEVFGFDKHAAVWRYRPTTASFGKIAGVKLVQIAVGGTVSQLDEVWGLDANSNVFQFNYSSKSFDQISGVFSQISVGEGDQDDCHPYEVWGINSGEAIFRYNYCTSAFEAIGGSLTHVATGGGDDVWGLNGAGEIFHSNFSRNRSGWFQVR